MKTKLTMAVAAIALSLVAASTPVQAISDEEMAVSAAMITLYDDNCQPITERARDLVEVFTTAVGMKAVVAAMLKIDHMREKVGNARFCEVVISKVRILQR